MKTIDTQVLESILLDCLFNDEEIIDGKAPDNAIIAEGVLNNFGFHKERLASHRSEIIEMLKFLPRSFFSDSEGQGNSFLNACIDCNGTHWGEHRNVEQLMCLGIGLGIVKSLFPRRMWTILPGGMPYYTVLADQMN